MALAGSSNGPSLEDFLSLIHSAFITMNNDYRERAAVEWAEGFTIPIEAVTKDTESLVAFDLNVHNFINNKRISTSSSRFSIKRIWQTLGSKAGSQLSDPHDLDRLLRLAGGIIIPTAPSFVPLSTPPPLRQKYVAVHPAVDKLNYTQWLKGQVVFIFTSVAVLITGIHFSAQHWALKKDAPQGRAVGDLSNPDTTDHQTVNGTSKVERDFVANTLKEEYGSVELPTLQDIVLMILTMWREVGYDSTLLVLFKLDLSGAYNLLDIHTNSIPKLAFALENDITVIHTTGIFGWSGTPYAFQVISRTLRDVCNDLIRGFAMTLWYIDDCLGVAKVTMFFVAIRWCVWVINTLLGPSANNVKKEQVGRRLDMLGWCMDLDTMAVSISRRNMDKAIYVFFVSDINGYFTLTEAQRLASLASRYSELCPHMRPYVASLFTFQEKCKPGRKNHLNACQKRDMEMWRAFLCLAKFDPDFYARPFRSFTRPAPSYILNYDASLTGLGVRVSRKVDDEDRYTLVTYASMPVPFDCVGTDSSYQNMCEYTAVLLGLLLIHSLGTPKGFSYILLGDSIASLTWMLKRSTNSVIAHNAHIGLTLISIKLDAQVADAFWLSSEDNFIADALSRGVAGENLNLPQHLHHEIKPFDLIDVYIRACDPSRQYTSPSDTLTVSRQLLQLLG
jgi:hypothetical protein